MRLRNVRGARDVLAENSYVLTEQESGPGLWSKVFGNENPVYMEIGMGKGKFLFEMAALHPDINYIGVEMYASVLIRAVQKLDKDKELPNIRFLNVQAESLGNFFAPDEVDQIYLNFSDPWPKARHAKRRLTSPVFLKRYEGFLKNGGLLEFKTDNRELFEYSLESIESGGWELLSRTFDLHADAELCEGNVMTEYEQKFSRQGQAICKLTAACRKQDENP
ncbi:MAG: tRNA (guanosine(46)-N7)-methyltransferase TrmB [Lachnospiraceae bacterium]|nr:tRNA (guanosine(46)-N7)-methyltransferase TrmB [Lachnospiraceae bacterium]